MVQVRTERKVSFGPIYSIWHISLRLKQMLWWESITPLETPVVPEVKISDAITFGSIFASR